MSERRVEVAVMETAMGPKRILTAGALRALLEGVDDDVHVVASMSEMDGPDWMNVGEVVIPGTEDDAEHIALTLYLEDTFDPRQF